jgi:hypothetical protein
MLLENAEIFFLSTASFDGAPADKATIFEGTTIFDEATAADGASAVCSTFNGACSTCIGAVVATDGAEADDLATFDGAATVYDSAAYLSFHATSTSTDRGSWI